MGKLYLYLYYYYYYCHLCLVSYADCVCVVLCSDNGERRRPCQGACQHTSCSACRHVRPESVDCTKTVRCASNDDRQCLRRFGRCVRRQQCSRQWYPCQNDNAVGYSRSANKRYDQCSRIGGLRIFSFFSDFKKHDFLRFFEMTYQKS